MEGCRIKVGLDDFGEIRKGGTLLRRTPASSQVSSDDVPF